jgi:type I restriction enzyme, S subunit
VSPPDAIGGRCPSTWELTTIGDICDRFNGEVQTGPFGSQLHAEDYVADGIPSVMPKDIVNDRISSDTIARVSEADAVRLSVHRLQPGDIVYARRGDIGRRALVSQQETGWLCGTGCLRIRLNCPHLLPEYLLAYLGHPEIRAWVESRAQGATMLNLNTSILRGVPLRVPPLPEQRRIADILDKADAIRRKRKEAITLTEELLRSAFLEMFGDPVRNEKGWKTQALGEVTELYAGNSLPPGGAFEGQPDGVLLLKVGDMNLPGNEVTIGFSREWAPIAGGNSIVAPAGAVVIPKRGGAIATNKKRILLRPAALDPNLMAIAPKKQLLLEFLRQWFELLDLASLSSGSAVPQLNKKDLDPLILPIPPMKIQTQFAQFSNRLETMRQQASAGLQTANDLFSSLVDRAFRGELKAPSTPTTPSASKNKQISLFGD